MSIFFATPAEFRKWLEANHKKEKELWVGFYKKATGLPSITWPESVDQALCFGWIDGIRKSIDDQSYQIRFTPRKPNSHWSDVNIRKMAELKKQGLIEPAGKKAFSFRKEENSRQAAYEQKTHKTLAPEYEKLIKSSSAAWQYYSNMSPSLTKQHVHWIMNAKKEETRLKRVNTLIEHAEKGEVIPPLRWTKKIK